MGVMTFSLVLYGEAVYDAEPDRILTLVRTFGRLALAVLSFPVLLLLGPPLAAGALRDLRQFRVRMDGLIVLAVGAAYALSVHHTATGDGEVYFDVATMVLVLVTFGRRLEAHARTHGRDAASVLADSLPEVAHVLAEDGLESDAPAESLSPGQTLRIRPGEIVPADVVVREGRSEVVAAHLTGEEVAELVAPGDVVAAGAVNGSGALVADVDRAARDGALGRVLRLLDEPLPMTRWMRTTDRLAAWLAAVAVLVALAAGGRAFVLSGAGSAIRTALAVLVVACPCALGLAVPLAYRAIRAALARRGVLVNDPAALEVASTIDIVLLDKTGTLTDPTRARVRLLAGTPAHESRMARLVAHSGHALAGAVTAAGPAPSDLQTVPGSGVVGTVDGVSCRAGSPDWMDRTGLAWSPDALAARGLVGGPDADGATLVAYAEHDVVVALGALRQELRDSAADAVRRLAAGGARVEVLSGDRAGSVARIGERLGVAAIGELDPPGKVAHVRARREEGARVLMAGDGINDAPALRAADVSVAMACGSAAARSQAQVEVLGGDLGALPLLLEASRELRRTIRMNLFWCVAYNGVALAAAAAGRLHPLLAVSAMIASSLIVSVRSYRLLDFGRRTTAPPAAPSDDVSRAAPSATATREPREKAAAGVAP